MAVTICPGKRSYSIIWNIDKVESCTSNDFFLENSKWRFLLETESSSYQNEEDWKMYLKKIQPRNGSHVFLISVYVEDRFKKLECLNFTRLIVSKPGIEQIMWRRKSNVLLKYPDLKVDKGITFVVTLFSDHRCMTDIKNYTENKLIQTPDYMEVHPCLENLSNDLCGLMESSSEPDLEIRCGDHVLHVHKAILIARSQVFAAMLQSDMLEKNKHIVEIIDMDHSILEIFLKYLYTGTLPSLDVDIVMGLYKASDKYDVGALKTRCALFLKEHLSVENACNILVLADTHCDEGLKECVTSYMVQKDILVHMEDGETFCTLYPKLAVNVLYEAYKIMKLTLKIDK